MWPFPKPSPELEELTEINKRQIRWLPFLAGMATWLVFFLGVGHLERSGLTSPTDWAWLLGSLAALVMSAVRWRRHQRTLDEVQRRINREAAELSFPIILYLLLTLALLDAAIKFPNRIDGDSAWYLTAFGSLFIYLGAWMVAWRRYFPTK
ncbi:MAG: hypothetical protein R3B35_12380 [Gemmatimonadales bacterium]